MFASLEGCLQPRGDGDSFDLGTEFRKVLDPHPEADAWLAADDVERVRLGGVAHARLLRSRAELGRVSRPAPVVVRAKRFRPSVAKPRTVKVSTKRIRTDNRSPEQHRARYQAKREERLAYQRTYDQQRKVA